MVQWPSQLVWYQQGQTLPSRSLHLQKLQREWWKEQREKNIPLMYVKLKSLFFVDIVEQKGSIFIPESILVPASWSHPPECQIMTRSKHAFKWFITLLPSWPAKYTNSCTGSPTLTLVSWWCALFIQPVIKCSLLTGHTSAEATIKASSLSESTITPLKLNRVQKTDNPTACLRPLTVW